MNKQQTNEQARERINKVVEESPVVNQKRYSKADREAVNPSTRATRTENNRSRRFIKHYLTNTNNKTITEKLTSERRRVYLTAISRNLIRACDAASTASEVSRLIV
jgi:hypothetical protein